MVFGKVVFTLACGFGNFGGEKEDFVFKCLSKWELKILKIPYFWRVFGCLELQRGQVT